MAPATSYAQTDPAVDDPPPPDPDTDFSTADDTPSEDPSIVYGDIVLPDIPPPPPGDTLDGTGAVSTSVLGTCPVNCSLGAQTDSDGLKTCSGSTAPVAPVQRCPVSKFLCLGNGQSPLRLVGVSADTACHQNFSAPENQQNFCNQYQSSPSQAPNWRKVIDNMSCHRLNKLRLWVTHNGNPEHMWNQAHTVFYRSNPVTSFPFEYHDDGNGKYWRLDRANSDYFERIASIVSRANKRGIYVEVTFFAPWEGEWEENANGKAVRPTGPFGGVGGVNGKICVDSANTIKPVYPCQNPNPNQPPYSLVDAGFTNPVEFVSMSAADRNATGLNTQIKLAREAQRNVIRWTLQRLWCFDKVYFEIANEPEASLFTNTSLTPDRVANWEAEMIEAFGQEEDSHRPYLQNRHAVAIQPFNSTATGYVLGTPPNANGVPPPADATELNSIGLVNGHYTTVAKGNSIPMDTGAINLARNFNRAKPIGFNETKISALLPLDTFTANAETDPAGAADAGRSEAWEFMVNLGAVYDHWGYDYASTKGQEVRHQLCYLKSFLDQVPLAQLKASNNPSWLTIAGLNPLSYPSDPRSLADASPYNYWASAEPDGTQPAPNYVFYLHKDWRGCVCRTANCANCESNPATTSNIPKFRGYHPMPVPSPLPQLTVTLKTLKPITYNLSWITPKTGVMENHTLAFSGPGCTYDGSFKSTCTLVSPGFSYDIALWLRPSGSTSSGSSEF